MLPTLVQQMMLVKLFIQIDPTVLPIGLVLSLISNLASLAFLAVLIVFFAIRYIPRRAPPDAKAQCRWRIRLCAADDPGRKPLQIWAQSPLCRRSLQCIAYPTTRSHSDEGKCFAWSYSPTRMPRQSDSGLYSRSMLCISPRRS